MFECCVIADRFLRKNTVSGVRGMANKTKEIFLEQLAGRYGTFRKLPRSRSLYELHPSRVRVYIRYSRVHEKNQTFYGLRDDDLRQLEGHPSVICFLWDTQSDPLLIPFDEYEEVFQTTRPARDGQYKAQIYLLEDGGTDLYIAQAGRFNVEGNLGWSALDIDRSSLNEMSQETLNQYRQATN